MFPVIDKKATGIRIRKIMDERGISVREVQEYLGLSTVQSVYHWLNGMSVPSVDHLYALSQFFQISIDEMLCGNRRKIYTGKNNRIRAYCTRLEEYLAA